MARKTQQRAKRAAATAGARPTSRRGRASTVARKPLITRAEMRRALLEFANILAPADVGDLLVAEASLRERAAGLDGARGALFQSQLDLALTCLRDHLTGTCPQIPFFTISLLAAAIAYLSENLDIIPDFLPSLGTLDDALVMALAFELADDGLRRYCTWKGITPEPALARPSVPRRTAHR